jgi:tetratricopeptide (TPR) repeat protein
MIAGRAQRSDIKSPIGSGIPIEEADGTAQSPIIAGYTTLHRLGSGGQGVVWLAVREADGKKAAIKIIRGDHAGNPRALARFDQAIATLDAIDHPRIVRSIEYGVLASGESWHATQYISGRTLLEYVNDLDSEFRRQRGRDSMLPIREIVELFIKLSDAVEAAHRVGVIHRDLKPSNIVIDEAGDPHILDFGHARAPESMGALAVTMTGEFIGSPAYASPEQVQCRPGAIDTRTDIYAIGIMLYECLTGSFPYDVSGPLSRTFEQIQYTEPTPLRAHSPWIDRDLQSIVLKSITKVPERRYQSVAEMRADLERYKKGQPVLARGDGAAYRLLKLARRHRALAISFAAILIMSAVYSVSITLLYHRAAAAESRARAFAEDARAKFRLAHDAAAFLVSDIDKNLRDLAGAEKVRLSIMQKAQAQFAPLIAEYSDDPMLQADIARVHVTLGDLAYNLGDFDESLHHRHEALRIREKLAAADPQSDERQTELSISLVLIGDVDKEHNAFAAALENYGKALTIDESLVVRNPADARYLDNLAWSLERVGCMSGELGDHHRRRDLLARRHEICESLVAQQPHDPRRLFHLCVSHLLQCDEMGKAGGESNHRLAEEHGAKASAIAERLFSTDPGNSQYAHYFIITRGHLAWQTYHRDHDFQRAMQYAESGHEAAQHLHEAEPGNFTFTKLLAESNGLLGDLAWAHGEKDSAMKFFHDRLAIFEQLHDLNAESQAHQDRLAWLTTHFDDLLAAQTPEKRNRESLELVARCAALLPPRLADVRNRLKTSTSSQP